MNPRDHQIQSLRTLVDDAAFAPVFRDNRKYPCTGLARIGYNDVIQHRYVIKADPDFPASGFFWTGADADVIVQYESIEALVDDGWRLD